MTSLRNLIFFGNLFVIGTIVMAFFGIHHGFMHTTLTIAEFNSRVFIILNLLIIVLVCSVKGEN